MKYLLLTLTVLTLLTHCTEPAPLESTATFAASSDQDTASYVPLYIHQIPLEHEMNDTLTSLGGYNRAFPPPMDKLRAQLLTKSYWVIEGYADNGASREQKIAGTGQWIKCSADGTFSGGHWERQTHAGVWYLHYNYKHPRLLLDSNVDRLDATWEMQRISGDQSEMAWVRLSGDVFGFPHRPFHVKLIELYDRPTKEQFAGIHSGL